MKKFNKHVATWKWACGESEAEGGGKGVRWDEKRGASAKSGKTKAVERRAKDEKR